MNFTLLFRVMLALAPTRDAATLHALADAIAYASDSHEEAAFLVVVAMQRTRLAPVNPFGWTPRDMQRFQRIAPRPASLRTQAVWTLLQRAGARTACPMAPIPFFRHRTCLPNVTDVAWENQIQRVQNQIRLQADRLED